MKPVQLQVNNSGAWKKVTRWDAGDDESSACVQEAVALLGSVDPKCTWRIATDEAYPVVLRRWEAETGWQDA